jgi:hypothetical protein
VSTKGERAPRAAATKASKAAVVATAVPTAVPTISAEAADGIRLARLHLRVGLLALALAELEDFERQHLLSGADRALLAEARWRTGDADGATDAARAHLDAGGTDPIALCIAAEAAAADGRPGEARSLMDRLGLPDAATLDALFAGMPRRAFWPSAPPEATGAETLFGEVAGSGGRAGFAGRAEAGTPRFESTRGATAAPGAAPRTSSIAGPAEVLEATSQGLWPDIAGEPAGDAGSAAEESAARLTASGRRRPSTPSLHQDPVAELALARGELAAHPDRALLRLALILRLDPTLAPAVLDLILARTEPAAAILRGDAQRLLGRHLEAEAAFAAAAEGLATAHES